VYIADVPSVETTPDVPAREPFAAALGVPADRALIELRLLLSRCQPGAPHAARLQAVEALARFVLAGPKVTRGAHPVLARLTMLVLALEQLPSVEQRLRATLAPLLADMSAIKLLAEIGLPNDRGLWAETTDRLSNRLLPQPPDDLDLAAALGRVIRGKGDLDWLTDDAEPLLERLGAALGAETWAPLRVAAADAMGLIASRLAALGLEEQVRARSPREPVRSSPFYQLARAAPDQVVALIPACYARIADVRHELEQAGVSVALVYSLDAMERSLRRLERLDTIAHAPRLRGDQLRALLEVLGTGLVGERSFRQLMGDNLRLMARKVIERAGQTGEHYVTATRREYWKMMATAAGGGVLTAGTAIGKFFIKWGHFAPFIDGLFSSLLYALSFLLIQFLGFTLATKQPSMTAAALAGTLRNGREAGRASDHGELIRLISQIARSQFAAAVGNVATVIIVSLGIDYAHRLATGRPFLDAATARATIGSFHPLASGTLFFAALTGVLLWLASLAGGWFENWFVYRRLPEAIAAHRWGATLGRARMERLAHRLEHGATGIGGSVALGFSLGMTPAFGKFFGLPLDVRHVTLSSGSLTLAVSSVGVDGVGWGAFLWASLGIALIGVLNFGVSFALALIVALRARDVPRDEQASLPLAVLRHFVRNPLVYFYPTAEARRVRPATINGGAPPASDIDHAATTDRGAPSTDRDPL
jgi:site-specific recombinase